MTRQYISTFKINMASLDYSTKTEAETRNYLLDEIKHKDLISEKHKKCIGFWITLNIF